MAGLDHILLIAVIAVAALAALLLWRVCWLWRDFRGYQAGTSGELPVDIDLDT